jgi:pimeloyl-ACP methyl ester carboxylesterase
MGAETRFLHSQGGWLAYEDRGAGPLVLCLPAPGDLRAEYRFLTPLLIEAGYRVVTMDLRGHGESSASWTDYSVARVGEDLTALLRYLDAGPALIISTSITAGAAICAAADGPSLVRGLVLIGPLVHDTWPWWQRQLLLGPLLGSLWGPALWIRYYRTLYPAGAPSDFEDYLARLRTKLREPRRMTAVRQMTTASRRLQVARLCDVTSPSLVLIGGDDPEYEDPVTAAWELADPLQADVALAEGVGHHPQCEVPAWTAGQIVAFAGRSPQTRGLHEPSSA